MSNVNDPITGLMQMTDNSVTSSSTMSTSLSAGSLAGVERKGSRKTY